MRRRILWFAVGTAVWLMTVFAQVRYYKGNTHTHSVKGSDSQLPTGECIAEYAKKGYDFLIMSEHDSLTRNEHLSTPSLLLINGQEVTGETVHFTSINATSTVGEGFFVNPYDAVSMIRKIKEAGGIPVLNHPRKKMTMLNFRNVIDMEVNFMEIYNYLAEEATNDHDDHSLWDSLLTADKVMYGIASDDTHVKSHIGHAWIMVRSRMLHRDSILASLRNGDFYASTGVDLTDVHVSDDEYSVASRNGARVTFITDRGKVLKSVRAASATMDLDSVKRYVRAVVTDTLGRTAWTQPYFPKKRNIVITSSQQFPLVPGGLSIAPNFPNPFNGSTWFRFTLAEYSYVTLRIYSVLGVEVANLGGASFSQGGHTLQWEPAGLPTGPYIARFTHRQGDGVSRTVSIKLLYLK